MKTYQVRGGGTITFDTENTVLKSILEGFLEGEITDNEERKKAPDGGNRLRGGAIEKALQKYAISSTGRIIINVEGAEHHFDLKRIYEYIHTPNGTLSFRTVGTPQRRFTGELAAKLYAALLQWHDHYSGGAI